MLDFDVVLHDLQMLKLEDLRKAAMLHETGLLFVPEGILQKTEDHLSDYEKDFFFKK